MGDEDADVENIAIGLAGVRMLPEHHRPET